MYDNLKRVPDWEWQLHGICAARALKAHEWGSNDCFTFAADCIEAMTGVDVMADMRDRYTTKIGAFRIVKRLGHTDLGNLVAERLPEAQTRNRMWRGDIALLDGSDFEGDFIAVNAGTAMLAPGPRGLVHSPLSQIKRVFTVGVR